MRVRVTKEYLWAPDGNTVRTVRVGEELEGEGAAIALQMGAGEALGEEKSEEPAAENKAVARAPRNKGR